jgi:glycerophosphoryl diester phosphodiesterase
MRLIAHRGNTNGRFESHENEPTYIDLAIKKGFDVEVDVWYKDGMLWLGHDEPQYGGVNPFIKERADKLWIHCKNVEAFIFFKKCGYEANYFWHDVDTLALTSKGDIWAYPGKQPIEGSIAVMPELHNDDLTKCSGICSDFVDKYKS